MASISSITQQYAKQQQQQRMKQPQKGGALFDFLKTENSAAPAASSSEPSSANVKPADPTQADAESVTKTEDKSMMETIKEKLNIGGDTDSAATSSPVPAPAPEPEVKEEKPGILSGLFGTGSSNKEEEKSDETASEASEETEESEASEASEANEESEASDVDVDDDNGNDFDMIAQKMSSLREKYDKVKTDYNALKSKMENQKAEEKKLDDSKVTTLIAAFTASQGALTAFKDALIEHLKNNNYPLDGLDLSEQTSLSSLPAEVQTQEPVITPPPPPAEVAPPVPELPADAPVSAPPAPAPTPTSTEAPVNDSESVSEMSDSESESGSESGSESESGSGSDSEPDVQAQAERVIENEPTQVTSSLPEVPVNEMPQTPPSAPLPSQEQAQEPASPEAIAAPAPAPAPAPGTPATDMINGGRSHYVHAENKKASTHRRHKRRNRHQTLRNYKK